MQTTIVVLGEVLMDCITQSNGSFIPHEGGSPYNVARAIALQGGAVTFANPISTDDLGNKLSQLLLKDGVKLGMPANALPTSLAMVNFVDGQPNYQFYREGVADRAFTVEQALTFLDEFPQGGILHTGSLALVPPEADKTLTIVKAAKLRGWTISCDINLRPRLARDMEEYRRSVRTILRYIDWLKASDEDLLTLTMIEPFTPPEDALGCNLGNAKEVSAVFKKMGISRIALTFGAEGAHLHVDEKIVQGAAPKLTVADTVGCGDTFWGTCVLAWARGETDVSATLNRALKAAAINATRAGCSPPRASELAV